MNGFYIMCSPPDHAPVFPFSRKDLKESTFLLAMHVFSASDIVCCASAAGCRHANAVVLAMTTTGVCWSYCRLVCKRRAANVGETSKCKRLVGCSLGNRVEESDARSLSVQSGCIRCSESRSWHPAQQTSTMACTMPVLEPSPSSGSSSTNTFRGFSIPLRGPFSPKKESNPKISNAIHQLCSIKMQ